MGDLTEKQAGQAINVVGGDDLHKLDILNIGGIKRAAVDANISSVNVPLGKDPLPDMYFTILTAGAIGDTIRIQIAATANDSTSPDSDLPAVDYTYTLVAADVGDEVQLAHNFADGLNNDANFQLALLESAIIGGDLRPVIHITSLTFSMNGEFAERPNGGDVAVTPTGTTTILLDGLNDRIISRAKEVSLARDPNNPHRLGVQSVSGTVRLRAQEVEQVLKEYLIEAGLSNEMTVNGSVTPIPFRITANALNGQDKLVESLKFIIADTNIKVGNSNFLGLNSALTNGILVTFVKNGIITYTEPLIKDTNEILGQWSTDAGDNKIINQSGGDYLESTFNLVSSNLQFLLEAGENDYIEVLIQDNLSSRTSIKLLAGGFLE